MAATAIIAIIAPDLYIGLRKSSVDILSYIIEILKLSVDIIFTASTTVTINSELKYIMLNEVTIYEKSNIADSLTNLINNY